MDEGIGSYLQELRAGLRLTTTQMAQKADIRRATLSDWQSGRRQPRLPELEAVLNALGVSDAQKRKAQERLRTPTRILRLREETAAKNQELVEVAGLAPHGGDLIRAMRMRKGWTQAELAEKVRISQTTMVRWERAERWPDTEALHTLCYLLGAREEELTALTLGRFSLSGGQSALTEEAIRDGILAHQAAWYSPAAYGLAELRLLNLMAHAWSLAARHSSGHRLLAAVNVEYVDYLFMERRFGECYEVANRTLDIYSALRWRDEFTDRVAIRLAEASAQRGSQQGVAQAISLLQQWLPGTIQSAYTGWILRDLAQFKADRGEMEAAIALGRKSVQQTEEVPGLSDYLHRRYDLVRILVKAGRAQEAQEFMGESIRHPFFMLVQAETYHGLGESATAHRFIKEGVAILENPASAITQPEATFYRPVVESLVEQLEGASKGR